MSAAPANGREGGALAVPVEKQTEKFSNEKP